MASSVDLCQSFENFTEFSSVSVGSDCGRLLR